MQMSTSATHGRLVRKRSDHCKASYSAGVQACNCVGGVVLAGELVDGGMEDGAEGMRITGGIHPKAEKTGCSYSKKCLHRPLLWHDTV